MLFILVGRFTCFLDSLNHTLNVSFHIKHEEGSYMIYATTQAVSIHIGQEETSGLTSETLRDTEMPVVEVTS